MMSMCASDGAGSVYGKMDGSRLFITVTGTGSIGHGEMVINMGASAIESNGELLGFTYTLDAQSNRVLY